MASPSPEPDNRLFNNYTTIVPVTGSKTSMSNYQSISPKQRQPLSSFSSASLKKLNNDYEKRKEKEYERISNIYENRKAKEKEALK